MNNLGYITYRAIAILALTSAFVASGYCRSPLGADTAGFPADAKFFPIGIWMQSPANAAKYKAMGINTYVGLWKGPTEAQLSVLANAGMFAVAEQNAAGLRAVSRRVIKAWMQADEPDNAQEIGPGKYGPCIPAADVARRTREIKARDPTRPVLINFGQGVADPSWIGRGVCTGDMKYYDTAVQEADILSFDIYPVGTDQPAVKGKLEFVAKGVANLKKRAGPSQRVWAVLETTALSIGRPIKPEELRAEAWMALIHGATGLVYFAHEFAPNFREDAVFRYPDIVKEIGKINLEIRELAPVINGPEGTEKITVSTAGPASTLLSAALTSLNLIVPVATLVKRHGSDLYVFAVSMRNEAATARMAIEGVGEATVEVLGEQRTLKIERDAFQDTFAGYGVHLYRIRRASGVSTPH